MNAHTGRLTESSRRGRTGFNRFALGSVAEAAVRSAPCSVLVMKLNTARSDS